MGRLGLEPRTIRLKAEYSTIELVTQNLILKVYTDPIIFHSSFY